MERLKVAFFFRSSKIAGILVIALWFATFCFAQTAPLKGAVDGKGSRDLERYLKNPMGRKIVLVDFWAEWCGPCRAIGPVLEELSKSKEFASKVLFLKVNVDKNPDLALKYKVKSIPLLLIFRNGKVVDQLVGSAPRTELEKFIKKNL